MYAVTNVCVAIVRVDILSVDWFPIFSEMHQFRYNTTMQYGKKLINTINFMYNIIFQKNKTRARIFLFTFTSIRDVSFFINNRMELKK